MNVRAHLSVSGSMDHLPSVQDIDVIARTADPVIRNLRITHAYHRLATAFAADGSPGANWCTFAVWASRQAGQTIRGEDLLKALERKLRADPEAAAVMGRAWSWAIRGALKRPGSRRDRLLRVISEDAFARAADAVARGNLKVFEEIGREFARFLSLFAGGRVAPDALAEFLAGLRPGDPPEGQEYLRHAFTHYAAALESSDPRARAELFLLANLEIGFHEQTRLQPEIGEAMEVPYSATMDLGRRLLPLLFPSTAEWIGAIRTPLAAILGASGRLVEAAMRGLLRRLITESLMTLALPGGVLRLGRDLDGEPPERLREPALAELVDLLGSLRPTAHDPDGAGADDWSVLHDRMCVICRLFRLRHEDASLFSAPFTPEQVLAFESGVIPDGSL